MPKKIFQSNLMPVISGLLSFVAFAQVNFLIGWICFVPLFISIFNKPATKVFKIGFVFGITFSCFAFSWMVSGAERFTGYSSFYGFGVFVACAFFTGSYWAALLWCFARLRISESRLRALLFNSLLAASLFCVAESVLAFLSEGLPWLTVHSGYALAPNLYAIQPAAFFGVYILSFVVVLVNYLVADFIFQKRWKKLTIPVSIVLLYLLSGYILLKNFEGSSSKTRQVKVAILAENIPPDIKWDDNNGNMLVQRLLDLNHSAVDLKPDIILWSESAVPWTYRKDDDLVNEVLRISAPVKATNIMGINTEVEGNEVNNSAYCILPNGEVMSRYDKQYLLSFIEKPMSGALIPFFSSKGFLVRNDAEHSAPLNTPCGKAGVLICNESVLAGAAARMAKQGAEFFCNMGNDGWFNNTYIVRIHFYNTRLRAVETRKDVVVNCNNGYSGLIGASGNIAEQEKSTDPFVKIADVYPNNYQTLATKYPLLLVYLCAGYVLFLSVMKFIRKGKTEQMPATQSTLGAQNRRR